MVEGTEQKDKAEDTATAIKKGYSSLVTYANLRDWMRDEMGVKSDPGLKTVMKYYPLKVNSHYLKLIQEENDPIWRQAIPSLDELDRIAHLEEDPLREEVHSPIPLVVHRYPDRALFLVSNECAMYCRFCTRKRKVGDKDKNPTLDQIDDAIQFFKDFNNDPKNETKIRDIIISGGDPLMLPTKRLEYILDGVKKIPHLDMVRIGTRVPCVLPQRITEDDELVRLLGYYSDEPTLYINTHFNHPREITKESKEAAKLLARQGIPLGCQTVLLKGVNDDTETMKSLMHELLKSKIRPYYLYMADLVEGTGHFQTTIQCGLDIIHGIRGYTSGLAQPHFIIDGPGGMGKTPLLPGYVKHLSDSGAVMKNYKGQEFMYPNPIRK